jgi:hypothetical protein
LDALVAEAVDPDDAIFDLHFIGDVAQPVCIPPRGPRQRG